MLRFRATSKPVKSTVPKAHRGFPSGDALLCTGVSLTPAIRLDCGTKRHHSNSVPAGLPLQLSYHFCVELAVLMSLVRTLSNWEALRQSFVMLSRVIFGAHDDQIVL